MRLPNRYRLRRQPLLQLIQRGEKRAAGLFIGALRVANPAL